ncbi:MAG TPA: MipA/OmpV family protein, partial [Ottowia sp.]|nr:MipA/OmpV family protein [Ottowia sp.]HPP98533.1 MipA/OmpV family protein [Ottowia sp.]
PARAAISPRVSDWGTRERPVAEDERVHLLVGAAVRSSPDFFGPARQRHGLRPTLAVEWGRLRLSTGGGYGLMGQGRDGRRDRGAGLEGMLRTTDRFNLSLSLNIDRGRNAAATDRLQGLPDVPTTLRARLRARYFLTDRWTASVAVSQDILGKHGGLETDAWLGYDWPLGPDTLLTASASASWGNGPYLRSQFGVPASAAGGFAAYRPGAGLYQSELGLDVAHVLSRHWVAFGGVRLSQLHGDARRSPLVHRRSGAALSVGLAWRN